MTYNTKVQTLATLVLVASIALASTVGLARVDYFRVESQRAENVKLAEAQALPPQSIITAVLFSVFRGLAVDILWYRANSLKEEGKLFEANQCAQWITELQPRFPQVWAFHAWNMAYNISVMTKTPLERWDWVNKGIDLLRKGVKYNPRATRLYRELGWIFFHKIGQSSDDMHWYYKQRLAGEWLQVLGGQRDGMTTQQIREDFKKIVDAPDTLKELIQANPGMDKLVARFEGGEFMPPGVMGYKVGNVDANYSLVRRLGDILAITGSSDAPLLGFRLQGEYEEKIAALFSDKETAHLMGPFLAYLRKDALVRHYYMDPKFMLKMMVPLDEGGEGLGPIDWRHPATQSMYWDLLGVMVAPPSKVDDPSIDLLNTYRGVIHSSQSMMQQGRVSFDPVSKRLDLLPDIRFISSYETAMLKAIKHLETMGRPKGVYDSYKAGYENFLLQAMMFEYLYGDIASSQRYYDKLRNEAALNPNGMATQTNKYTQPLETLVFNEMLENMDMQTNARQAIDAFLTRGIIIGLGMNRADQFQRFVLVAKKVHDEYNKKQGYETVISSQNRMALPPFNEILVNNLIEFMKRPDNDPLVKARVWRNAPNELKYRSYDRLFPIVTAQMTQQGFDPALAFAEPEGMAAYRKANPDKIIKDPNTILNEKGTGGVELHRN
jgi:hypothetical protein